MTRSTWLALSVGAIWVVGIITANVYASDPEIRRGLWFVVSVPSSVLMYAWCKAYAHDRSLIPPSGVPLIVSLFTPLAVPLYFFALLPWKRALAATGLAGLYALGCLLASGAALWLLAVIGSSNNGWSGP